MSVSLEVLEGSPPRFRLSVDGQTLERPIEVNGNVATFNVPTFSAGAKVINSHDWILTKLRRLEPGITDLRVTLR